MASSFSPKSTVILLIQHRRYRFWREKLKTDKENKQRSALHHHQRTMVVVVVKPYHQRNSHLYSSVSHHQTMLIPQTSVRPPKIPQATTALNPHHCTTITTEIFINIMDVILIPI
ncbi:unnamed protein product [Lactuca virosa]|uniref:Uncharacterized protein n=1 Tax=Lactuca virosa TaxID=75947 RepID=A0AAU9NND9_9ASTR|nr:unnamed protein product [Lactuca virosa]